MKRRIVICLLLLIGAGSWALADRPVEPRNNNTSVPAMMQDQAIKTMIDMVSRQVARRYDLRPDQASVARDMLEKNTRQFVTKHYNDLLTILPQMQTLRDKAIRGEKIEPGEVKDMARKVAPIYKEATDLIVSENAKFHELLDDNQKAKHQEDLNQMYKDVKETQTKFNRWKEGGYKEGEFNAPRRSPRPGAPGTAAGRQPNAPGRSPEPDITSPTSLSYWDLYVKKFIEAFALNDDQKTMAMSVLNDKKIQATAYRDDHSREFAEIKKNIDRAIRLGTTQPDKELKPWQQKLDKLEKPLLDMFNDLAEQLMAIPTEDQKKTAQAVLNGDQSKNEVKGAKAEKK